MDALNTSQVAPAPRSRPRSPRRRGNAILEAALVLPILLMLSFGTVEFGHFFYLKHTLQGGARDGCRVAILPSSTNTQVTDAVAQTMTAAGIDSTKYTVQILNATTNQSITVGTTTSGTPIKVTVSAVWGNVGIRPLNMISSTKQVAGFTIMIKE